MCKVIILHKETVIDPISEQVKNRVIIYNQILLIRRHVFQ